MQARRLGVVAAVLESLEALHLVAFPKPRVLTAHRPIRNPQIWRHWPQEQEGEVALCVGQQDIIAEGYLHIQSAGTGGGAGRPPGTGGAPPEALVGTAHRVVSLHAP